MRTTWKVLVIIAAISNIAVVAYDWHAGNPATWFVWVTSISFCIGVILDQF